MKELLKLLIFVQSFGNTPGGRLGPGVTALKMIDEAPDFVF